MPVSSSQKEAAPAPGEVAARQNVPVGPAISPLNVAGLVVTKVDLIAALRIYVPHLIDIALLDGERFVLSLATLVQGENERSIS